MPSAAAGPVRRRDQKTSATVRIIHPLDEFANEERASGRKPYAYDVRPPRRKPASTTSSARTRGRVSSAPADGVRETVVIPRT
ncbi:hypothetical protein GCM10010102_09750 [Promicromonospora citrea]|uniref:Uncharacterized protein n=1 Tax=Promicromonospora citrea TaxID=43677 RepID=A0A8H9L1Y8_9MICO|nr:hypothetical protein GCM10010102_09750 [Promicromonospora citrea]